MAELVDAPDSKSGDGDIVSAFDGLCDLLCDLELELKPTPVEGEARLSKLIFKTLKDTPIHFGLSFSRLGVFG